MIILGVPRNVDVDVAMTVDVERRIAQSLAAKVTAEITEKTPEFGQKLLKSFAIPSNHNVPFPVDQNYRSTPAVKLASGALSRVPEIHQGTVLHVVDST